MGTEHILGPDGELYHWGIRGMKWGIRRYQTKNGSLTPAGKKRYNKDMEKIKAETKRIKNQERTDKKLGELESARKQLAELKSGKKSADDTTDKDKNLKKTESTADMSDKVLQDKVNRLRNEDAYKDLTKKLGYDMPTTEMDVKIAELEKQKKYLELQRDIKNLTPEKVSLGKKIAKTIMGDIVGPAATKAGKEVLEKFLKDTGMDAVGKVIGEKAKKEAAKVAKENEKAAKKEAEKEAKEAQKQAEKETKESKKQTEKSESSTSKVYEGTVEGFGTSSKASEKARKWTSDNEVIDAEYWEVSSSDTSSGKSYVSNYLALPAPGLPAPKDDD